MTDNVRIVSADPRQAPGARLLDEMAAFITRMYPEDADEAPPTWTLGDMAQAGSFLLAYLDRDPAGCGGIVPIDEPGALEIVRMYVRPGHRGHGVAGRILSALEHLAMNRGATRLVLRCGPRQPEALKMYESGGYKRRGVFGHHVDHPTNIFLEKQLGPGDSKP